MDTNKINHPVDKDDRPVNLNLRNVLFLRKLTHKEVAQAAGVPRQYISLHINGRWVFNDNEKRRIAEALQCPIDDLF